MQREADLNRLTLFPNLDYVGLHQALVQLVDVITLVQFGTHGNLLITFYLCVNAIIIKVL